MRSFETIPTTKQKRVSEILTSVQCVVENASFVHFFLIFVNWLRYLNLVLKEFAMRFK